MKRMNLLSQMVSDALLIACGMLVCACTAPSAFRIPFEVRTLVLISLLSGFLLSAWMHLPKLGVIPGLLFLGGGITIGILDRKAIAEGARVIFYAVAETFSWDVSSFGIPEPVNTVAHSGAAVTSLLLVVAALFGMLIAFSLIRSKLVLLSILIPIPPFLCGLIYTDQQPALWTAMLLTVYCGGVLLGHGLRKADSKRSGVFTLSSVTLLIAAGLLLLAAFPQRSFTPISYERRREVLGKQFEATEDLFLSWFGKKNPREVDLGKEGTREESTERAFEVYATREGTYLLRAHSYGAYRDGTWQAAEEYSGAWRSLKALGERRDGDRVFISVHGAVSSERLVPYGFLADADLDVRESFVRAQGKTSYIWAFYPDFTRDPGEIGEEELRYDLYTARQYVMFYGREKSALLKILRDNGIEKSDDMYETAQRVASFVRASGTYTLTPGKVPDGEDFVQYFLTESHQGYCVHFASATTALLQALEIPARYTVGYRVDVAEKETWTDVLERSEHAWTEIYLAGVGWIPIESTPGMGMTDVPLNNASPSAVPAGPAQTPVPQSVDEPIIPPSEETPEPVETPEPDETPGPYETPTPNETPEPNDTPEPSAPGNLIEPSTGSKNDAGKKGGAWWLLLLVPFAIAGWIALGALIRRRRTERFRQPNARQAVIELLRYRKKLERFGVPPDPDAEEWADEAAFSNHAMTEARRELFKRIRSVQRTLYMDKPFRRFLCHWILSII